MIYAYPCQLSPDEDGAFIATFPDIPEAITGGSDHADALTMAEDALATALAEYVHQKRDIPSPSAPVHNQFIVSLPTVVAAKLALYSVMREQRISKTELARRLGISETAVRRITNPDHRSHINQVENALKAVGQNLNVQVVPA